MIKNMFTVDIYSEENIDWNIIQLAIEHAIDGEYEKIDVEKTKTITWDTISAVEGPLFIPGEFLG